MPHLKLIIGLFSEPINLESYFLGKAISTNSEKHLKTGDKALKEQVELFKENQATLAMGKPVRSMLKTYSRVYCWFYIR